MPVIAPGIRKKMIDRLAVYLGERPRREDGGDVPPEAFTRGAGAACDGASAAGR